MVQGDDARRGESRSDVVVDDLMDGRAGGAKRRGKGKERERDDVKGLFECQRKPVNTLQEQTTGDGKYVDLEWRWRGVPSEGLDDVMKDRDPVDGLGFMPMKGDTGSVGVNKGVDVLTKSEKGR